MRSVLSLTLVICLVASALPVAAQERTDTSAGAYPEQQANVAVPSNADAVRQAVVALGIGKTVEVKTTSSKKFRGKIQSIDQDGFTIVHGLEATTDRFAYADVSQVGKAGMRTSYKVLIGVGVAAAVTIILGVLHAANTAY